MSAKGLSLGIFLILFLAGNIEAAKNKENKENHAGPYIIIIQSIKDMNKNYKEFINWSLKVTKIDKKGPPHVIGFMDFLKEVKYLVAGMDVWKKDSSKGQGDDWKKYQVDEMKFGSVCTNPIMIIFFKQFKGISWDFTCSFKPQKVDLNPIDINEKMHAVMDKAEYGMFKVHVKYWSNDPTLPKGQEPKYVMWYEMVVNVQKKV